MHDRSETYRRVLPKMSELEHREISDFVEKNFGIRMPPSKKTLLESRLSKRLIALDMSNYAEYFHFLLSDNGLKTELKMFEDLVSTHETSFFREPHHFEVLKELVIPEFVNNPEKREVKVLSAASSSGEEAYSIAMILERRLRQLGRPHLPFSIEGIDLSEPAIKKATLAIYDFSRLERVPDSYRHDYFMKSKNKTENLVRIVPEIRDRVSFHEGNFLKDPHFNQEYYDIIFCRNMLIYFSREDQIRVINLLLERLSPRGYLFLGHAEAIMNYHLPVQQIAVAVYQKKGIQ